MFKNITIVLALAGVAMGVYSVATSKPKIPSPPLAQPASVNPFPRGIAALGVVESGTRDIAVAPPEPGLVVEVQAHVTDRVEQGAVLFRLDDRPLRADLVRAEAALAAAEAEVKRLERWPRAEEFPPVEAEVEERRVRLADAETRYHNVMRAVELDGASQDEVDRLRNAVAIARAALANAESRLAVMKSGSWEADLAVARANAAARRADIEAIMIRIDRLVVRAPASGTILRRNIEPGEFVTPGGGGAGGAGGSGGGSAPAMILGDLGTLHVRAQVDEEDAPLLRAGAAGRCRLRGPFEAMIELRMLRIEPFARPKSQITGSNTERIDTRVVEAVFEVATKDHPPMYPGQVVDVYIEAPREERFAAEDGTKPAS